MKQHDKIIKEALQSKMERLDSGDFANKIVRQHLAKKAEKKMCFKFDFISLISGLIFIIITLLFGVLIGAEKIQGLTIEHTMIVLSLTVIFLIYRLLSEITTPNMRYSSLAG